jgi:8-oxo-dGTP diphosphatase
MKRIICILGLVGFTSLGAVDLPDDLPPNRPVLTASVIIEVYNGTAFEGIVLIERLGSPYGYALPGGSVEYGERVEEALQREALDEVNLDLKELTQFHVYSDPMRDLRYHSVEVTFTAKTKLSPQAGGDARRVRVVGLSQIPWDSLTLGHAEVLRDYLKGRQVHDPFRSAFRPPV